MKWIDISHILDNDTPLYPRDYHTSIEPYQHMETDGYNACLLKTCMHTGTHVDMPMHLIADERTADQFPLDGFAGRGVLLDVRGENPIPMRDEYRKMDFEGAVVLLYTGFGDRYKEPGYFTDHPSVSAELCAFLLSQQIKMLGMDAPAPDHPPFEFHKALLREGIFVLENAANLGALLGAGDFEVMAFPLKIAAEASLVRAVCRII